jgi:hypothetical protein
LKWSEELKLFFENRLPPGAEAGAYMTAAVDDFFNLLAAGVREDREGRKRKPARLQLAVAGRHPNKPTYGVTLRH